MGILRFHLLVLALAPFPSFTWRTVPPSCALKKLGCVLLSASISELQFSRVFSRFSGLPLRSGARGSISSSPLWPALVLDADDPFALNATLLARLPLIDNPDLSMCGRSLAIISVLWSLEVERIYGKAADKVISVTEGRWSSTALSRPVCLGRVLLLIVMSLLTDATSPHSV